MIDADNGSASPSQKSGEIIDDSANAEALIRALNEVASSSRQRQFGDWTSSEDEVDDDLEQAGDSVTDEHGKSFRGQRNTSYDEFLKSFMNDELSDEEREIEIEGSGDSLRTIEIEISEETAGDVQILAGDLLASTVFSSHTGKYIEIMFRTNRINSK